MNHEEPPKHPDAQVTRWSLIRRAADASSPEGTSALEELLNLYQPAIDAYLSSWRGLSPADAQDFRQEFINQRLITRSLLQSADPGKGKFRSLLRKAIENFVNSQLRRADRKREIVVSPELEYAPPVRPPENHVFDVEWASRVVAQALENTRRFYEGRGQLQMWELFEEHRAGSARDRGRIKALAAKYGCASEQAVSNVVVTVQRKFGTELRNLVRDTLDDPDEDAVNAEIRELIQILTPENAQPEFGNIPECKNEAVET